jgi:hypothetical protein
MDNNLIPAIGEFVQIPAWRTEGMVIKTRPSTYRSDIEVLIETRPDDPNPRWYRLAPGQFTIVG